MAGGVNRKGCGLRSRPLSLPLTGFPLAECRGGVRGDGAIVLPSSFSPPSVLNPPPSHTLLTYQPQIRNAQF